MPWSEIDEGPGQSERIPGGIVDAIRILRIVTESKKNGPFFSKAGDSQIMLIFADNEAREASVMITLNRGAAWKLKNYLLAIGANLDNMDRDGVDWNNFKDKEFASRNLCDRPPFRAEVRWEKGTDGKDYADVIPLRVPSGAAPIKEEIPI